MSTNPTNNQTDAAKKAADEKAAADKKAANEKAESKKKDDKKANEERSSEGGSDFELTTAQNNILNAIDYCDAANLAPIARALGAKAGELGITADDCEECEFEGRTENKPGTVNVRSYCSEIERINEDDDGAIDFVSHAIAELKRRKIEVPFPEAEAEAGE